VFDSVGSNVFAVTEPLVVAKVIVLPTGMLTTRLMVPLPVVWLPPVPPQVAPPVVAQVQLIVPLRPNRAPGKLSCTLAPVTALGPLLVTTMV
jgi:hypothetical protein